MRTERRREEDLDYSSWMYVFVCVCACVRVGVCVVDTVAGCASRLVSWRQDHDSFLPERTSPH